MFFQQKVFSIRFATIWRCLILLTLTFFGSNLISISDASAHSCYQVEAYCRPSSGSGSCTSTGFRYSTSPSLSCSGTPCGTPPSTSRPAPDSACGISHPPVNCVGSFTAWSGCIPAYAGACGAGNGAQFRTYNVSVPAANGGAACPYADGYLEGRVCNPGACTAADVDCAGYWTDSGACSVSCGGGTKQQTFTITTPQSGNGAACPASPRTIACNTGACSGGGSPVDCAGYWTDSGACSVSCGGGTKQQSFVVTTAPSGGGTACPTSPRTIACNTGSCGGPVVNCAGFWIDSTSCSVSCGGGTKQQSFVVTTAPSGGGTACPTSPRTIACNTGACAANQPDLTSSGLSETSGSPIEAGQTLTFTAQVTNDGTLVTPNGFEDVFQYRYGNSGSFTTFRTINKSVLAPANSSGDSASYTIPNDASAVNQTLYIQHCIDADPDSSNLGGAGNGDVNEIDESVTDNCSQINLGVVNPAPAPADLVPIIVDLDTATAVPDPVTGTYDGIKLSMRIRNVGTGDLPANSNAIYRSILNIMGGGQSTNAGNLTSVLASGNRTGVIEHIYNNIPFGNHQMCVEVNLNPKNYVDETNMANNNGVCSTLDLAVPPPDLQISAEPKFVRAGGKTNLNWSIEVGYELVCTLRGSGIDQTFTVGTGPGTSYNGSQETGVLNSTAVYRLSCTEPTTSTSFDPIEVKVEVVPGYEEV